MTDTTPHDPNAPRTKALYHASRIVNVPTRDGKDWATVLAAHGSAAIAFAILDLADALRPQPVPVNIKVQLEDEAVQEAVRQAIAERNRLAGWVPVCPTDNTPGETRGQA